MLKIKFAAKIFLTLALATLTLFCLTTLLHKPIFGKGENYRFYVGDTSKNCKEIITTHAQAYITKPFLSQLNGESVTVRKVDLQELLNKVDGKIVFCEQLEDSVNYYCQANLPYSITLYGTQINLHICIKNEEVIIASPIIFGGY